MLTKAIVMAHASRNETRGRQLMLSFVALFLAVTIHPSKAHAQIIGSLEANIPFQFQAGTAKLPPGNYSIRMVENSGLIFMQIINKDNSTSAAFQVRETDLSSAPTKNELVFNKYGDRYFLSQLFDEGNPSGSEVVKSHAEEMASKAAAETKVHVATQHGQQQGD